MQRILILLAILIPNAILAQDKWIEIGGLQDNFKLNMFGEIIPSIDTLYIEDDEILMHSWTSNIEDESHPNRLYMINSSIYPSSFIHSDSTFSLIEGFLNSGVADLLEDDSYEYLSSTLMILEGYPGKEYKFKEIESGSHIIYRSYLIQNQFLELISISNPEKWFNLDNDKFHESLKLIDRKTNTIDYGFTLIETPSYEIDFPSEPKEEKMFVDSDVGKLNLSMKILETKNTSGTIAFLSGETKYPENYVMDEKDLEEYYTLSINGTLASTNATLLDRKEFTYKGYKGVEFYASLFEGKITGVYRSVYIENTTYISGVLMTDKTLNKEAKTFMDSFKIIKTK